MDKRRKKKTDKRASLSELLSKIADVPPDVLGDAPMIELRGRERLLVCGCREMVEYSSVRIKLVVNFGIITIRGRRLIASSFCERRVSIEGEICALAFGDEMEDEDDAK